MLQLARRRGAQQLRSMSTHVHHQSSNVHSRSRLIPRVVLATAVGVSSYAFGAFYPPQTLTLLFASPAPAPPDPSSPAAIAYVASLEVELQSLPALAAARAGPDASEWYETRPYLNYDESRKVNSFTAGALKGPGKLALAPLVRARRDETESVVFIHLGRGLCGHDGIVHGGMLATMLDESIGRTAILNLPEKVGVTASLSINYRAPTRADQFVVVRTKVKELKGRKIWVDARVEDTNGTLLAEATAMCVQPKYAKMLQTQRLRSALGEAPILGDTIKRPEEPKATA